MKTEPLNAQVVVLGAGPGGYTAAFRAADLGLDTVLVERYPVLGGVCLNVGCIPSKALLHVARVLTEITELRNAGLAMPVVEALAPEALRAYSRQAVGKLTKGLEQLAKQRKVRVLNGRGKFSSANTLQVTSLDGTQLDVRFQHAIIATGSHAVKQLPGQPAHPLIFDSTGALELTRIPQRMLVVGGGIIGLEMATVYQALGVEVTVVEMSEGLLPGCDRDVVRPLYNVIRRHCHAIHLATRVESMVPVDDERIQVQLAGKDKALEYDAVLVAIGRRPNTDGIGLEEAGIEIDTTGCIKIDNHQRTSVPHVYAIGDVAGQPMLAHKATHEGRIAAEVIGGLKSAFDSRVVPSVAYTDPEVAWVGLTEEQARASGLEYGKGVFPWAANGRSLTIGRTEGVTKLLFAKDSGRLVGMAAVGPQAGDLVAEAALAIEMGCDAADLALTIHPHPTLSETVAMAAEAFEGTITDLYLPQRT